MIQLEPQLIDLLRKMARDERTVPDMVREIFTHYGPSRSVNSLDIVHYFRRAFNLTLAQAKPITEWIVYDGIDSTGATMHLLVWPHIAATKDLWGRESPE